MEENKKYVVIVQVFTATVLLRLSQFQKTKEILHRKEIGCVGKEGLTTVLGCGIENAKSIISIIFNLIQ